MTHQLKAAKVVTDRKLLAPVNRLEYLDTLNDLIDALKDLDTKSIPERPAKKAAR